MKSLREIIIAPLLSEKGNHLKKVQNSYIFRVSITANKIEIKKAIEKIFAVDVLDVNTIRMKGKPKRLGKYSGYRPDWKKAIVTLKDGQSIADFEI